MISVIETLGLLPIGQAQTPQADHNILKFKKNNSVSSKDLQKILKYKKNNTPITESKHQNRNNVKIGKKVKIIKKEDQNTNNYTVGKVEKILTNKKRHTRGIKVRLDSGEVGRVQEILN